MTLDYNTPKEHIREEAHDVVDQVIDYFHKSKYLPPQWDKPPSTIQILTENVRRIECEIALLKCNEHKEVLIKLLALALP